ncbi:MAG: right-handed parallel beta-helix repeat-containing protein [Rhodospirillales bacterium]
MRKALAALGAAAVAAACGPAVADMVIRLKDGTVHRVPADPADIESITFGPAAKPSPAPAPAAAAAPAAPRAAGHLLRVGAGGDYDRPSQAAAAAKDGDIVEIAAGIYDGDVAVWKQANLTIRGVGGIAKLQAGGRNAGGKAIWVVTGADTLIENVAFSGARVPDGNGAGVRIETKAITLRNCIFHDNQNGILAGDIAGARVTIEDSQFFSNGAGDGYTHNIYVGAIAELSITGSAIHHAKVGHQVKSRAAVNRIAYSSVMDGADGNSSYLFDFERGGVVHLIGNVIQQGPNTDNFNMINFASQRRGADDRLVLVNNTLVNDYTGGVFVGNKSTAPALLRNNVFAGPGSVLTGPGVLESNLIARATDGRGTPRAEKGAGALIGNLTAPHPGFVDAAKHDYRLAAGAAAIDAAGDPGRDGGTVLAPAMEFRTPAGTRARPAKGALDIGAFEAE